MELMFEDYLYYKKISILIKQEKSQMKLEAEQLKFFWTARFLNDTKTFLNLIKKHFLLINL